MGLLTDDMKRVVRQQRLGFVATVCADGTPNLSPKGTTTVWDDDHLVFADICSPATVANLRRNAAVEINVVDPIVRKGYRFAGKARVLTDGPLFEEALTFYRRQGVPVERDGKRRVRSIVLVRVEHATALISPAYDDGTSEDEVRARWTAHFAGLSAER